MSSSTERASQGATSNDGHPSNEGRAVALPDSGYFSSSPLDSPAQSPFSLLGMGVSLGVVFLPDEGEANDILAALRASQRVVKETREVVMGLRPRTKQVKGFANLLSAHERDFTTWIYDGVGILPTTRIAIRSLPMFVKLAVYIDLLKDLQSDLPYISHRSSTAPVPRSSFLRRLSSSTPPRPRSNSHASLTPSPGRIVDTISDPKLAISITKIVKSFEALKDSIAIFTGEQRKLRASVDVMERTRKEMGIPHDLCLQGTRKNIKYFIEAWVDPSRLAPNRKDLSSSDVWQEDVSTTEPTVPIEASISAPQVGKPVLLVLGPSGSGKSALATTLACEWRRRNSLGAHLFMGSPRPTNPKWSTGRKSSSDESEAEKVKKGGRTRYGRPLQRALSRIVCRRGSTSSGKVKSKMGEVASFVATMRGFSAPGDAKRRSLVVVDGLDQADEENVTRVTEAIKSALERVTGLRVIIMTQRGDSPALETLRAAGIVESVQLEGATNMDGGSEVKENSDADDIKRYIASRLAVLLTPQDQERVVEAVHGNFADAVRICRDIGETGAPERALDGVLYREAVRRHGMEHVKVILV